MTDFSGLNKGIDVSHHQGKPNWDRVLADGFDFVMIKCAESGAVDVEFDNNRKAIDGKVLWLPYAFLRPGDTDATIRAFCDAVGTSGIPAAIDWEADNVSAAVVERWIDRTSARLNHSPLLYYGRFPPDEPTPPIKRCPRWYPQYPGSDTADPKLPAWDGSSAVSDWTERWLIWQWTDSGSVTGIGGHACDLNRLSCSLNVFRDWYDHDVLPNAPPAGPASPGAPAIARTLRLHATGDDVTALQQRLAALGFSLDADGVFGPATQRAVAAFQASHGLQADGIVGPVTARAFQT